MRFQFVLVAALVLSLSLFGCANSIQDVNVAHAHGDGTAAMYDVSAAQAYDISLAVFRWEHASPIEEHKADGYMLGEIHASVVEMRSPAVLGAWVEPSGPDHARVTVVTKRKRAMSTTIGLTEGTFHQLFAKTAAIVKSGKPIPEQAPE